MTLKDSNFIKIIKVKDILIDQEACGINSIITLIKTLFPKTTITIEELKKIFNYDDEGISREDYRFNRLNQRLSKDKCTFKIYESKFSGFQELFRQLSLKTPVPIIMNMEVIERFKDRFKYPKVNFNWGNSGDLFRTEKTHILLLVGYENKGEKLYFIDPSYQLPHLLQEDLNNKTKMLSLSAREFFQYAKSHMLFISIKHSKRLEKKFKRINAKEKQKKLKEVV